MRGAWLVAVLLLLDFGGQIPEAVDFAPNVPVIFVDTPASMQLWQTSKGTVRLVYPKGSQWKDTEKLAAELKFHGAVSLNYE